MSNKLRANRPHLHINHTGELHIYFNNDPAQKISGTLVLELTVRLLLNATMYPVASTTPDT